MKKKYVFCFDLDNIIYKTNVRNYKNSIPNKKAIKLIDHLFQSGHIIIIFTARYMGRYNDNLNFAKKKGCKFTIKQLNKWVLKYNKLIMGKPSYDNFIDDKSYGYKKNWMPFLIKNFNI